MGAKGTCETLTSCNATDYNRVEFARATIQGFRHKGLRNLFLKDEARGVPPESAAKLRAILTFLQDMRSPETLGAFPLWKAHQLTGARKGTWSVHVTKNWRLTFRIEEGEIHDVDFEDCH